MGEGVVGGTGAREVGSNVGTGLDGTVREGEPGGVVSRGADVGATVCELGAGPCGKAVSRLEGALAFVDADAIWMLAIGRRSVVPSLDVPVGVQPLAIVRRSTSVARDKFGLRGVGALSTCQRLIRCNGEAVTVATRSKPRGAAR